MREFRNLAFGVFQVPPQDTERIESVAPEAEYRSIDTAVGYHNEKGVGKAIASSGLPREEIFVTTKLWKSFELSDQDVAAITALDTGRRDRCRPATFALA
jgi:2,5-diketo-D-gluconate reductase A